jgi:hypothetical protein
MLHAVSCLCRVFLLLAVPKIAMQAVVAWTPQLTRPVWLVHKLVILFFLVRTATLFTQLSPRTDAAFVAAGVVVFWAEVRFSELFRIVN